MIITSNQIEVTFSMMSRANMTRGSHFAVPYDFSTTPPRIRWMEITEMSDEDFDNIEKYFLIKQQSK